MNEFDFIHTYLAGLAGPEGLELRDDVAVWSPPVGKDAVISTDALVEGVHFPTGKFDSQLAQKLIRSNVSDIVAKGADPLGYVLSLTLNEQITQAQLGDFCQGLANDQHKYGLKLWGGDTTRTSGPIVLSVTIIGTVSAGKVVKRSTAQPGDILCVTGTIGEPHLGLKFASNQMDSATSEKHRKDWLQAYHVPNPPYGLRHSIRSCASAALDVSDGLIADAGHLAKASNISLTLNLFDMPISPASTDWVARQDDPTHAMTALATGGDDYQVLLTVNPVKCDELLSISTTCDIKLTKVGSVDKGEGIKVLDKKGRSLAIDKPGYTHF